MERRRRMTAELTRLMRPKQSPRRTDLAYFAGQATFFWLTVGAITGRLLVETYAQTLRLYGWEVK